MIFTGFSKIHILSGTSQDYISQVNSTILRNRVRGLIELAFYSSMQKNDEVYGITSWCTFEDYQQNRPVLIEQISQNVRIERILLERHVFKLIWEQQVLTRPVGASSLNQLIFPEHSSPERLDRFVTRVRQLRHKLGGVRGVWIGRSLNEANRVLIRTDWVSEQAQLDFLNSSLYREATDYYMERGITSEYGSTQLQLIIQPAQKE